MASKQTDVSEILVNAAWAVWQNSHQGQKEKTAREGKRSKNIFVRAWKKHLTFFTLASNFPWKCEAFFPYIRIDFTPKWLSCWGEQPRIPNGSLPWRVGRTFMWIPHESWVVRSTQNAKAGERNCCSTQKYFGACTDKKKNVHLSEWTNIQLSRDHSKCFWGPNCTRQGTAC